MRLFICLAILLATLASRAHAEHDDRPDARARPLFEAGREAYVAGHFREAAEAFERVFTMTGHPFMLRNLGNAYEKLGEREKASAALHQYLRLMPDAADKAEIERQIAGLEAKAESRAEAPAQKTPGPAVSTVAAAAPKPAEPAALEAEAEAGSDPASAPVARDSGLFLGRTYTWIALSASAAFAATAAVLWIDAHGSYDKLALSCGSHGGCSDSQLGSVSHGVTATNVMLALSGAALTTAVVLFFTEGDAPRAAGGDQARRSRAEQAHTLLAPSVDRRGAGVLLRASF